MGAPPPIKLRLYRAPEQVLINCYCPFGADRLHVAMLPASQNAIWITRAPIDPEFDALALADVLSPYRRPEPSRHPLSGDPCGGTLSASCGARSRIFQDRPDRVSHRLPRSSKAASAAVFPLSPSAIVGSQVSRTTIGGNIVLAAFGALINCAGFFGTPLSFFDRVAIGHIPETSLFRLIWRPILAERGCEVVKGGARGGKFLIGTPWALCDGAATTYKSVPAQLARRSRHRTAPRARRDRAQPDAGTSCTTRSARRRRQPQHRSCRDPAAYPWHRF
jgi:hypothetical protein